MKKYKAPEGKGKGGKLVKIDEALLRKLAAIHCSYEEMGWIVECSADTLTRRFKSIIEQERAKCYASLRKSQFKNALRGNATLLIYLGKVYLKQRPDDESKGEEINVYINDNHMAKVNRNGKEK